MDDKTSARRWHFDLGYAVTQMNARPLGELDERELGTATWRSPDAGWGVNANLIRADDGTVAVSLLCIGMNYEPGAPAQPVTAAMLRQVPFGALLAEAQQELLQLAEDAEWRVRFGDFTAEFADRARGSTGRRRPGRPREISDDLVREVAMECIKEASAGRGIRRRVAATLSERLGHFVADETVRDWIRVARDRGFLAPARPGSPTAAAGPRLLGERSRLADEPQGDHADTP